MLETSKRLRLLIVDENEAHAERVLAELKRAGFAVSHQRVDAGQALSQALETEGWDIVICSDSTSLAFVKDIAVPVLVVSDATNESSAVAAIRAGARDFLPKGHVVRLVAAIERVLGDATVSAERTAMQERLLIADRMASVGTLAAGVAHEINSPLAALIANVSFIKETLATLQRQLGAQTDDATKLKTVTASLSELDEPLSDTRECADRVRQIVHDLRTFSREDDDSIGAASVRGIL